MSTMASRKKGRGVPAVSGEASSSRKTTVSAVLGLVGALVLAAIVVWLQRGDVRRDPKLSVVLISIDTLRADALGVYGNTRVATPAIDRLAKSGWRFENAHAHNVVTFPSHSNILSGLIPTLHGVRDNTGFRFPSEVKSLATRLKERGFKTGAFVSAFVLDSKFGLDQGFDVYDDRTASLDRQSPFMVPDRVGTETVAAAMKWIEGQGTAQFFAFVHLYDPHFPYRPAAAFATRHKDQPYWGEVEAVDAALEPLLTRLAGSSLRDRTLVILTSDHGESLEEHGESTHGIFAYEPTLRVPLIVAGPVGSRVLPAPVQHIDIVPTVLDALGAEVPGELPGRSLFSASEGSTRTTYFESLSTSLNQGWAPLRGVLDGRFKFIDLPLPELYDVSADPGEKTNLVAREPEILDRLRSSLNRERTRDKGVKRGTEDQATLERLRALGYVAASSQATTKDNYTEADDPKNLIEIDTRTRAVVTAFMNGQLDEAIALAKENLRKRPGMAGANLQLAYLQRAKGDLPSAIDSARRAVDLKPLDAEAVSLLGAYLTEAGRAREAVSFIEPYVKGAAPDYDVMTALGLARAALGQVPQAREAFEAAKALDASNGMAWVNLATLSLMTGERNQAKAQFVEALRLDSGLAKAHNGLGVMAAQEGRPEEAITHWRAATDFNPRDYQTLFNLASTLDRLGRRAEAEDYYRRYLAVAPPALEIRDIERVRSRLGQ